MGTLIQDIRYGFRILVRNPAFTVVVVLLLALGIGANTVMFSVVNTVLLRPLPYEKPDEIVVVWQSHLLRGWKAYASPGTFFEWRERNKVFDSIAAFDGKSFTLTGSGEPERIEGARVSHDFFPLLAVKPLLGRRFLPEEEQIGTDRVVVLSHGLWQRRFGSESDVIGKTLKLDGREFAVIGILPPGFEFPLLTGAELWTPMALTAKQASAYGDHWLHVIARLRQDVTIEQADAAMDGIARQLEQEHPKANKGWGGVVLRTLHEEITKNIDGILLVLLGAVGFLLLVACANVASLLLARVPDRQKEIAIRTALGAGSHRLLRQLLTESVLLAALGAGLGLLWSVWGIRLAVAWLPSDFPRIEQIGIDSGVLGFTLIVSILTGMLFGLAPALQSSRIAVTESLKEGGPRAIGGFRSRRLHKALIVFEVAVASVLLIGSGLMIRSLTKIATTAPGFDPEHLLTMNISLPESKYSEDHQAVAFFDQLLKRVETLPGVQSAAAVSHLPTKTGRYCGISIEGHLFEPGQGAVAAYRQITPGYFPTMGIPLIKGRYFEERDTAGRPGVVIINQKMARGYWPEGEPIGKRLKLGGQDSKGPWLTIVGVIGDLRNPLREQQEGSVVSEIYLPHAQAAREAMRLVVRTAANPLALVSAMRDQVSDLDADLPISEINTMKRILSGNLTLYRFITVLPSVFASLALLLAGTGLYGVIAHSVSQRTHEIGVRMALGAQVCDLLKLVLGQGMKLALIGVAVGLIGAFALTRVISSLLYEVSPTDPLTFVCVSLFFTVVALLASYIPAHRATKVDPMIALRYE